MILDATTKSIEIDLAEAHTTTALPVTVDYVDMTTTTTVAGSSDTATNNTTAVTIVAAPAASTQRKVNALSVYNADTVSHGVTIQLNNAATLRTIVVATLQVGESLGYTDVRGWFVLDASGSLKQAVASAAISGGTIDNAAIGGTTPAAGAFTTLSASGQTSMLGKTAFLAALSTAQSNVTGDGTAYTIICNTEVFDQASDYNNATGVFTAPVTGKYRLSFGMLIQGLTTSHTAVIGNLVTSNRTYPVYLPSGASGVTDFTGTFSALCDMDAGDTAYITIVAAGGTKVVDVLGTSGSSVYTTFSGEIVC